MVSIPTRGNNILDLFFTNNSDAINYISAEKTIFSDHNLLKIHTTYNKSHSPEMATPTEKNPFSKLNFFNSQVNWDLLNAQLQCTDWESEPHVDNPEVMLNDFLKTILRACEGNVPTGKLPATRRSHIPRDRKVLMRRRANLNRQMQTTKSDTRKNSLQAKISHIENELKDSHEKQRDWEETRAVCNIKANPKFFFKYYKKFSKMQVKVGPLQSGNGMMSNTPEETCQILSQQYTRIFLQPTTAKIVLEPAEFFKVHTQHHFTLVNIPFTITDVQEAISELKINSAAGPDGVPSILLLRCKEALALPLYKIWRCSLDTGNIASILKEAIISPIHKGRDRSQAKNYRPVALISHLIKVEGDPERDFCTACQKAFNAELTSIKRHSISEIHLKKERELDLGQNELDGNIKEKTPNGVVMATILFACFIAEHILPFTTADNLVDLMKRMFPDSQSSSMKRTKYTDVIKTMGRTVTNSLAKKLRTSKFPVIMDESTDVSTIKSCAVIVRFYDSSVQKITTAMLDLVNLYDSDNNA
ncbi:uncharacterized protein [Palaemon carinicauda]|uniref:uncharacterized protein n=1 Tax=Palaemon carinicauda TaxID=392227 RepID=UPI0035B5BE77